MKFLFDWAKYSIFGASCCTSSLSLLAKRIRLCATTLNGLGWDGGMRSITKFCQSCRRNGIERSRRRLECRSSCPCPSTVLLPCRVPTTAVEGKYEIETEVGW